MRAQPFAPSVYLAVDRDGAVTIWLTRSEMGQGVATALPMIIAEEMDADFRTVRVEQAVLDGNHDYGKLLTAASASIQSNWIELRRAGAAARQMLIAAACRDWGVSPSDCETRDGAVFHSEKKLRASYGSLAESAAKESVPLRPRLKRPEDFRLIGSAAPRVDVPEKVTGRARFGLDVSVPRMVRAAVARCPAFGGKLVSFDETKARAVRGVLKVVRIENAVAVIAENTWAAFRGRDALDLRWDFGPNQKLTSGTIADQLSKLSLGPGVEVRNEGSAEKKLASAEKRLDAEYRFPFLAHAAMEPLNATARVSGGRCEVWAPTQHPEGARDAAARAAGLPREAVTVRTLLLGGGFGRRSDSDEVAEAVQIAKQFDRPVQVVWSREDDLRHGRYREVALHRLSAALGEDGMPVAWVHRVVSPSIEGKRSQSNEVDGIVTSGSNHNPYAIDDFRLEWSSAEFSVPVGIWRAVGHSHGTFAVECFMDELARASGLDPVVFRRRLLPHQPRLLACLNEVANKARWGEKRLPGRALGCAVAACFGSFSAQVAEVSASPNELPRVHRVWCVVDTGIVINPDIVRAQLEGGIAFGLTAALHGRIEIANGGVLQSNFHDYPLLRHGEMPEIDLTLLKSGESPGGVGELSVPAIAPAVANAIHALTRKPVRGLPFERA